MIYPDRFQFKKTTSILSNRINNGEKIKQDEILDAVNKENILCIDIIDNFREKPGKQIAGSINIFNPGILVISGTVSARGSLYNTTYPGCGTQIFTEFRQ